MAPSCQVNDLDKTMAFFTALGLMETRRKESENGKFTLVFMASAPGKRDKVSPSRRRHHRLTAVIAVVRVVSERKNTSIITCFFVFLHHHP